MIVYSLRCANDHVFEAWFRDSAAYDRQAATRTVVCPYCGSKRVGKAPMAPRLAKGASEPPSAPAADKKDERSELYREARRILTELRRHVETHCDYVGSRFAEEARKIHYGETKKRDIYGEASPKEAGDLKDEGIEFQRIPWLPRTDS
ncbi:MAG: DUF1178 family protein [Proteobacteria bacterium]|nr:DUF1178 family protein [Pseudomonadota bacterium]